jgi:hypothetical protein
LNEAVKQQSLEPPVEIVVATATSGLAEHPRVIAGSNEKGLKLIGGGATVDYGTGPGNLLTGSYPEGNFWVASSKSHCAPSAAKVTAYAIYLYDPDDLWDVKMVSAKTQSASSRPKVTANLPAGYALTGGGALLDWGGYGMLLTACYPEENNNRRYVGWTAKGKDHKEGDSGNATAWVFGIRPRNGVEPTQPVVNVMSSQLPAHLPTVEGGAKSSTEVIVGGGAAVIWTALEGGLLTRTGLTPDQKWKAQAKDHLKDDDSLDLTMWVVCRTGRMLKYQLQDADRLAPNEALYPNQSIQSKDGRFRLTYQDDGNLVLYKNGKDALWSSRTFGTPPGCATMQSDGNLVVYNQSKQPVWSSQTPKYRVRG